VSEISTVAREKKMNLIRKARVERRKKFVLNFNLSIGRQKYLRERNFRASCSKQTARQKKEKNNSRCFWHKLEMDF
jgi:hypothetical protein